MFCFIPPSLGSILMYLKWPIGSLMITGLQAEGGLLTALFTCIFDVSKVAHWIAYDHWFAG